MNYYYAYLLIDPDTSQPFYVGKGTGTRMYEHFRVRSRLTNPLLKNKILKLEREGKKIVYEKVLINASEELAFMKEKELIEHYGRKINRTGILCNLTEGGEGNSSTWTDKRRLVQSEFMKSQPRRLPIRRKPVSQYTIEGKFVQHWPSAKEASEHTPANRSYITQVCKERRKSAGGFLWTYNGKSPLTFTKQYYRSVVQLDLEGNKIANFQSLTEAQKQTGVELHNISECCRSKSITAGGFVWRYFEEFKNGG